MIGSATPDAEIVRKLWELFDKAEFEAAGELVHEDFVVEWPQSRERIRGRANFVAVNKNYPGRWRCTPRRILTAPGVVVSEVEVSDGKTTVFALSFFETRGGRLARATEYWGDSYPPPAWRAAWVERT